MLKTSMLGLGSAALCFVIWRALVMLFVLSVIVFKIVVFFVIPLCFAIWVVRKLTRSERVGSSV